MLPPSWMLFISIFTFTLISNVLCVNFCYICQGTSSTSGHFCNLDKTCMGSSCILGVNLNGSWSSSCVENTTNVPANLTPGNCISASTGVFCSCAADFCNSPKSFLTQIKAFAPSQVVDLPDATTANLTCFECGTVYGDNVGAGNSSLNITCDGVRNCPGTACLTRRSLNPRSYCADKWMGELEVGCTKTMGQDELCVCKQSMCNYPYIPMTGPLATTTIKSSSAAATSTVALPTSTTTSRPTTTTTAASVITTTMSQPGTTVTLPDGTIVCPDGKHYGPNEQAVFMGEKLKATILSNFGKFAGSKALNNFESGINYHICNYKNK